MIPLNPDEFVRLKKERKIVKNWNFHTLPNSGWSSCYEYCSLLTIFSQIPPLQFSLCKE
jgi:hypothetical protein